jgi:hypothetical protein
MTRLLRLFAFTLAIGFSGSSASSFHAAWSWGFWRSRPSNVTLVRDEGTSGTQMCCLTRADFERIIRMQVCSSQ